MHIWVQLAYSKILNGVNDIFVVLLIKFSMQITYLLYFSILTLWNVQAWQFVLEILGTSYPCMICEFYNKDIFLYIWLLEGILVCYLSSFVCRNVQPNLRQSSSCRSSQALTKGGTGDWSCVLSVDQGSIKNEMNLDSEPVVMTVLEQGSRTVCHCCRKELCLWHTSTLGIGSMRKWQIEFSSFGKGSTVAALQ